MNQRIQTQTLAGRCLITTALYATLLPGLHAQTLAAPSVDTLRREFLNPPDAARPMVRWWWFGTAVVEPEILRELLEGVKPVPSGILGPIHLVTQEAQ